MSSRHPLILASLTATLLTGCLNPSFVNNVGGGGGVVPLAPGDTPFVQILVVNATESYIVDVTFGFTPAFEGSNSLTVAGIMPEQQAGVVLPCPVTQLGLGDPSSLSTPAVVLTLADDSKVNIPAGAFPFTVMGNEDFVCGDTVVFTVAESSTTGYGISISSGRVLGSTQTGPFSGPDTFAILEQLITAIDPPGLASRPAP